MMLALQTFADGDTNYVAKLNNNFGNLESAISGIESNLQAQVAEITGGSQSLTALFGSSFAVIGDSSYLCHGSGTTLTVDAGFAWRSQTSTVVQLVVAATFNFTGLASGTYYMSVDSTGAPVRNTGAGTEDLYSVVWSGSAFGTITRLCPVVWGAADFSAAQNNAALGTSYTKLDDLLEAIAAKAVAGDLARTNMVGRLDKSVAGGADITLTDVEANNAVMNFTGTLTANINVIVPLGTKPRKWVVTNNTSGAFTLTLKGSSGTGIAVAQDANLYQFVQDGTDVKAVSANIGAQPFDVTAFYPAIPSASAKVLRVPMARAVTFPANFSGSYGKASVAATASTAFDVQKNGSSVGTITFTASGSTATFTSSGGTSVSFAAGDVLSIIAPGTPDATLADIGFVLAGTR